LSRKAGRAATRTRTGRIIRPLTCHSRTRWEVGSRRQSASLRIGAEPAPQRPLPPCAPSPKRCTAAWPRGVSRTASLTRQPAHEGPPPRCRHTLPPAPRLRRSSPATRPASPGAFRSACRKPAATTRDSQSFQGTSNLSPREKARHGPGAKSERVGSHDEGVGARRKRTIVRVVLLRPPGHVAACLENVVGAGARGGEQQLHRNCYGPHQRMLLWHSRPLREDVRAI
jgi:hypothetical protein